MQDKIIIHLEATHNTLAAPVDRVLPNEHGSLLFYFQSLGENVFCSCLLLICRQRIDMQAGKLEERLWIRR